MQQFGQILFIPGIVFTFAAGIALEVSASAFKQFSFIAAAMSDVMIFVGGALLVVAMRVLFSSALSNLWKTHD